MTNDRPCMINVYCPGGGRGVQEWLFGWWLDTPNSIRLSQHKTQSPSVSSQPFPPSLRSSQPRIPELRQATTGRGLPPPTSPPPPALQNALTSRWTSPIPINIATRPVTYRTDTPPPPRGRTPRRSPRTATPISASSSLLLITTLTDLSTSPLPRPPDSSPTKKPNPASTRPPSSHPLPLRLLLPPLSRLLTTRTVTRPISPPSSSPAAAASSASPQPSLRSRPPRPPSTFSSPRVGEAAAPDTATDARGGSQLRWDWW